GQSYIDSAARINTTTGNTPGVQSESAGPIFVNQLDNITIAETAAGTTNLDDYISSVQCLNMSDGGAEVPVNGSDGNWNFEQPYGGLGTDVVCTISNELKVPDISLVKSEASS